MMRQIRVLSKLELMNIFSINTFRHTKDKKAKKTGMVLGIIIGILMVLAMVYVGGMCYGYVKLGAEEIIPAYIVLLSSVFILLFCAFKAGKIIFKESCYDILVSMPIRKSALVISRYVRLYAEGLAVACVIMLPGLGVYVWMTRPGVLSVVLGCLSVFVVPVIPVVLSALLGVIIIGISSKMKNKSLFEALFVIVVVVGMLAATAMMPADIDSSFDIQAIGDVAKNLLGTIYKIYPPTGWFGKALEEGSVGGFAVGTLISTALLIGVIAITTKYFEKINRRLHAVTSKHDYKLGKLQKNSMMKAMVFREAKRYFSSGVYVTNTIIGPVMAVVFAVSMLFVDINAVFTELPVTLNFKAAIPIVFAGILVMNSPIVSAVSMEGKEFWIVQSMPISDKDILKSKLLFSALLLTPFYAVGEIILIVALNPGIGELVWMIILPMVLVLCALVTGLAVNLKFPKLNWDNEVDVVKQSAASMIGGLGGLVICIVAAVPLLVVPVRYYHFVALGESLVVIVLTIIMNRKNRKFNLRCLG